MNMIKPLTSLRFIFALMVFASHLSFLEHSPNESIRYIYQYVFREGYIGVSFFFILSGFILAYNYSTRILNSITDIGNFLKARFARIYPLHLLTMLMAIPLSFHTELCCIGNAELFLANLATNLLLVQAFFLDLGACCYLNGPSWSISVELFFYLMFPFLILITTRKLNTLSSNVFTISLISLGIAFIMWAVPNEFLSERLFYINPIIRCADFLLGIILFKVFDRLKNTNLKMDYTIMEVISVIVFIAFFALHNHIPQVYRYSVYYWPPISILILILAFQMGFVSRMLSVKWLLILGEISFALYMFHQIVLRYMHLLYPWGMLTEINRTVLSLIITIVLSYASLRLFEVPVGRFVKQRLNLRALSKVYAFMIDKNMAE